MFVVVDLYMLLELAVLVPVLNFNNVLHGREGGRATVSDNRDKAQAPSDEDMNGLLLGPGPLGRGLGAF